MAAIARDTSSAAALASPVVDCAATALAAEIVEPIPATSEAAAATISGETTMNAISDLAVPQEHPENHQQRSAQ